MITEIVYCVSCFLEFIQANSDGMAKFGTMPLTHTYLGSKKTLTYLGIG